MGRCAASIPSYRKKRRSPELVQVVQQEPERRFERETGNLNTLPFLVDLQTPDTYPEAGPIH